MQKIASLFISFTLLFTQLAPLAEATNIKITNPKTMTEFSMITMLEDPADPRWLSIESLEEMVNFLTQHPDITQDPQIKELIRNKVHILTTHCEQFFFVASQNLVPMDPLCDDNFNVQEKLLTIVEEPFELNGIQTAPFPEEIIVVKEVPQQKLEEKNTNNTIYVGTIGNGIVDGDRKESILKDAKELVRRHKPSTPKNEDYFLLEHADFSYLPFGGTDDIPAELKEFIRALNQATENGVELDAIMEEAIRAYLDPQYKGAGIFPPSYLSLLFKLYMDKVTSFQKAWSYVEVNTPASSKCQGTKCDDISRFAMEALLMQPRFREQLSQEQWTSIDEIINYKLSEFEVGSDEYITETVRMMILKEGKEKVQKELEAIVEKAIADGETPENTILFAGAELLQMSSLTIAGEAIPAPVMKQYLARRAFVETVRKVIFESATKELTASATKAITGVMGGTTASVAIPIAVIGLFTVGVGYALYDAYGFEAPDAKRHMINYVNREISNQAAIAPTIPTIQGNTTTAVAATQSQAAAAAQTAQQAQKKGNETCEYRYQESQNSWTLGEAERKIEIIRDQEKFRKLMKDCGFNYSMEIGDLTSDNNAEKECTNFVEDLREIDYVKKSFISSQQQKPLYTRIRLKGTSFLPAPELPIKTTDQIDLIRIVAQWFQDRTTTLLTQFFRILRGSEDFSGEEFKSFRRGIHEKTPDVDGYLHFHYEELKHYTDDGQQFPYICNHSVKYKPDSLSGIDDAIGAFFK